MCGRYSVNPKAKGLSRAVKLLEKAEAETRYNAAPSQNLPVITNEKPNEVQFFKWGLLPVWAPAANYHPKAINARAETLAEKATFRQLLKRHRCLVPADGFYEWKTAGKAKTPFRILLKSEDLFTFAGLWDEWTDQEIPTDKPIMVHCAGGYRSAAGASIIQQEVKDVPVYDLSEAISTF